MLLIAANGNKRKTILLIFEIHWLIFNIHFLKFSIHWLKFNIRWLKYIICWLIFLVFIFNRFEWSTANDASHYFRSKICRWHTDGHEGYIIRSLSCRSDTAGWVKYIVVYMHSISNFFRQTMLSPISLNTTNK